MTGGRETGLDLSGKILAALLGFLGGSFSVLIKPWLERVSMKWHYPIRQTHEQWIFIAGYDDPLQNSGITLEAGRGGPRTHSAIFNFRDDPDGRNFTCQLEDRGELNDLVERGLIEICHGRAHLTNKGWIYFEEIKEKYLDRFRSPLMNLLTPISE